MGVGKGQANNIPRDLARSWRGGGGGGKVTLLHRCSVYEHLHIVKAYQIMT